MSIVHRFKLAKAKQINSNLFNFTGIFTIDYASVSGVFVFDHQVIGNFPYYHCLVFEAFSLLNHKMKHARDTKGKAND